MSRGAEFITIDTSLKQQFDGHWNIKKKKMQLLASLELGTIYGTQRNECLTELTFQFSLRKPKGQSVQFCPSISKKKDIQALHSRKVQTYDDRDRQKHVQKQFRQDQRKTNRQ